MQPASPSSVPAGGPPPDRPVLRGVAWTGGRAVEIADREALAEALRNPAAIVWLDVTAPEGADIADITDLLDLHPLIAEDIAERNQRAKFEEIEGTIHIVMFSVTYDGKVVDGGGGPRPRTSGRCSRSMTSAGTRSGWTSCDATPAPSLRGAPTSCCTHITDGLVDDYFPVMDAIEDEIDDLQDEVIRNATPATLERLFVLKRELIGLRRATSPAREIFNQLTNRDLPLVASDHVVYFRDVYDHLIRVTDELDNDRDLVAGTLDVYLSTINNNLSIIMKRLTGVTVILAGIGAFAGIFGMSEAGAAFAGNEATGFWLVTTVVFGAAIGLAWILHRRGWI